MRLLSHLFENNRAWSAAITKDDPDFFRRLATQQAPRYLWIGCADSRVPANEIVGLLPGELLVHRNVANVVVHADLNCLSVIQFAVEVLKVRNIIVCGHYGCGGVLAALRDDRLGLVDNWLRHVQDVAHEHAALLAAAGVAAQGDLLCRLNVIAQVTNVCRTTIVQEAWAEGKTLNVHGVVYGLADGVLRDLAVSTGSRTEVDARRGEAIARLAAGLTP